MFVVFILFFCILRKKNVEWNLFAFYHYVSKPFSVYFFFSHQDEELEKRQQEMLGAVRLDAEVKELRKENSELKQYVLALQGEVYGARLAAKYLDKELAGRSENKRN